MKKKLLKFLQYYKYPQYIFARNVANEINALNKPKEILDLPCGQGLTSYILANNTNRKIIASDISSEAIEYAKNNFSHSNIAFSQDDIHNKLETINEIDCICIINSLFLLPEPEKLLNKIHNKLNINGLFILVVPNTESRNFKTFQTIDSNLNSLIITPNNLKQYFQDYNFKVNKIQGCAYSSFWNRRVLKYFWIFGDLYLNLESTILKMLGKKPQYFTIVLSK